MKCPRCQHENRSGAKFCEECATPLARTCTNCGVQLSATAKFCAECAHGVAVTPGPLASPESYTPKDLLGRGIFKPTVEGTRKQVTVPSADMKGSIEFVGDEMHMARPSEGASPPDTDRAQGPGIPRIAIGTGAALVALLIVALYTWLPTAPRSPVGDRAAAVVPATGAAKTGMASEPSSSAPERDDPAPSAMETPREADRTNAPARPEEPSSSIRTASTTRPSTAAASASKADLASRPPREPGKTAALGAGSAGAREHAEQARSRVTAARLAAERVAAGFYARNRFLSAQTKERDGMAALGKSAYVVASALFAEAQSEYQAARAEAPFEEENQRKVVALRASVDQAHAAVAMRRQQALAAQADQRARELFDQAEAQQVEGDGLASGKDLAAATRAYQEAAARYGEATERARAAPPAK